MNLPNGTAIRILKRRIVTVHERCENDTHVSSKEREEKDLLGECVFVSLIRSVVLEIGE
jgi:hypothetical protein